MFIIHRVDSFPVDGNVLTWCHVYTSWRGLTELLILIGGQLRSAGVQDERKYRLPRLLFYSK